MTSESKTSIAGYPMADNGGLFLSVISVEINVFCGYAFYAVELFDQGLNILLFAVWIFRCNLTSKSDSN